MKPNVTLIGWTTIDSSALHDLGYEVHRTWDSDEHRWGNTGADELAEYAGRNCYMSEHRPNPKTATNRTYLKSIIDKQHFSVFSHASAVFVVDCSRACSHEIARHIFLGKSEVSQRYVNPHKILDRLGVDPEPYREHLKKYDEVFDRLYPDEMTLKDARDKAREELPMGFPTRIVLSGNFRAWRDFLSQRLSDGAAPEIREVAYAILKELQGLAPHTFQDFGGSNGMEDC